MRGAAGWMCVVVAGGVTACAQEQKPEPPRLLCAAPLGIVRGATTKVTLRGLRLDGVTELKTETVGAAVKLLSAGKTAVPMKQEPGRVGDTQVEVEITLPADAAAGDLKLTAVAPSGTSPPFAILVEEAPPLAEVEPNDGLATAQSLPRDVWLAGSIHQPQNVDVYRFDGQAGETVVCEVVAARRGSGCDGYLTLFDAAGRVLSIVDDAPESADPVLKAKLPATGPFFLAVSDAHDQGGPAHLYRLRISRGR